MSGAADEVVDRAQARVGTVLGGKWRIDALLGAGGMAVVYSATHRNNKRAAIKMLHAELSVHSDIRARFLREGYVANTVDHPGAVSVLDDDVTDDGAAYLVMELLEGETVADRAERKGERLPPAEVLSIADQLLDVLVAAHAKGIIHRDIKPDNLFLDRNNQLKVLDFGIARLRESSEQSGTRTGSLMGTPSFMPPEQARGLWNMVDGRSDLWAVGATMFALLSGNMVHHAQTANEALAMAITQRAPSLATVMPGAPPALVAVVDRALAYEKEYRFPDAAAMQQAVREAFGALQGGAQAPGVAQRPPLLSQPGMSSYPGGEVGLARTAALQPGAAAPVTAAAPAQTTTRGVAGPSLDIPAPPKKRSPILLVVGIAIGIGAIGLVAVAAFVLHGRGTTSTRAAAGAPSAAPSLPASQTEIAPAVPAVPSASAIASASAGQVPSAAPPEKPTLPQPAPVAKATRHAHPPAPKPAKPEHASRPAPTHTHTTAPKPKPASTDSLGGRL